MKDAVLAAVAAKASLDYADLSNADLSGITIEGYSFDNSSFDGELIFIVPLSIFGLTWSVFVTPTNLKIGCKKYLHEEWFSFDEDKISQMEPRALSFWTAHKTWLLAACAAHRAESEAAKLKAEAK